MKLSQCDTVARNAFPPPPIQASKLLVPITTWSEMFRESRVTAVDFDQFWYDHVEQGVAYFFSWLGSPRSTVMVVWNDEQPTHIEARTIGGQLVPEVEAEPIVGEVTQLFRNAGFWRGHVKH